MSNQCIFCQIIAGERAARIVYEDKLCIAFLDHRPQTRGHMQLVPRVHVRWIWEHEHMGELFDTAGRIIRGIIPVLGASGATIACYGREVPHAHIWIVPQYVKHTHVQEGAGRHASLKSQDELDVVLREALIHTEF